jgi:hypothetical protein
MVKKENLPLLILIASFKLIILNIIISDAFYFLERITANIFIILGVISVIKNKLRT